MMRGRQLCQCTAHGSARRSHSPSPAPPAALNHLGRHGQSSHIGSWDILWDLATVVLLSKVSWRVARGMPPPSIPSYGPLPLTRKSYFGAVT